MNYSDYRFTLDIQLHQAQVSVPVTFGDSARRLCIGLTDGRKPYVIGEGCMAVFNAKKPDGTKIKNYCIIENNTVIYEFTPQTTNCEGIVNCDITIYDINGKALTSPQFIIVVDEKVVRDDDIVIVSSEDESTILSGIITEELQRAEAEENRVLRESDRVMSEGNRVSRESARVEAEENRVEAETKRALEESGRVLRETERVEAEENRASAETDRASAEKARVEAEENRVEAETKRALEESGRVLRENERVDAEVNRVLEESRRVSAETDRASAETDRASAEKARVEEEKKRVTAENNRASLEAYRDSEEKTRRSKENERIINENKRISAENARVEAEIARVALIGKIDRAIDAIIAIQNSFLPTTYTIDFIDPCGVEYTIEFEEGMTWGEWVDSNYNRLGAYVEGGGVRAVPIGDTFYGSYYVIIDNDTGFDVYESEVIDINKTYGYLVM